VSGSPCKVSVSQLDRGQITPYPKSHQPNLMCLHIFLSPALWVLRIRPDRVKLWKKMSKGNFYSWRNKSELQKAKWKW